MAESGRILRNMIEKAYLALNRLSVEVLVLMTQEVRSMIEKTYVVLENT